MMRTNQVLFIYDCWQQRLAECVTIVETRDTWPRTVNKVVIPTRVKVINQETYSRENAVSVEYGATEVMTGMNMQGMHI